MVLVPCAWADEYHGGSTCDRREMLFYDIKEAEGDVGKIHK